VIRACNLLIWNQCPTDGRHSTRINLMRYYKVQD
jgi:hypothetical protein